MNSPAACCPGQQNKAPEDKEMQILPFLSALGKQTAYSEGGIRHLRGMFCGPLNMFAEV